MSDPDGPPVSPPASEPGLRWGRALLVVAALAGLWALASALATEYHRQQAARAAAAAAAGEVLTTSGQLDEAAARFRSAVALEPDRVTHRLALAKALVRLERFDEAERYLQDVLRVDATNGDAYLALARAQRARARLADAEASYYRAIYGRWAAAAEATRVQTRLELIDLLGETADRQRVRGELTQLASSFPGDRALLLRVGRLLLDTGFPADAAQVFRGVVERFADPGPAAAGLAEASLAAGDYAAAAAAARRALAIAPDDRASANRLALASAVDGLDPNRARLSARERSTRTRRLLDLARVRLEGCRGDGPLAPEGQELRTRLAASRPSPVTPAVLDEEAQLLEDAARAVMAACPAADVEAPLDLVLRITAGARR